MKNILPYCARTPHFAFLQMELTIPAAWDNLINHAIGVPGFSCVTLQRFHVYKTCNVTLNTTLRRTITMPAPVNSNYSANFQKFVDVANKAYASKSEDTIVRFSWMPKEDYTGTFASVLRTSKMKAANDEVRSLFRRTIAGMFGGEKYIPDIVRDNMKLDDFGKGKPLTARRIKLVQTAIDLLGGGKFAQGASVGKALSMGYLPSELPKLARVANLYQLATNCTDAEAEAAALDPGSNARRLFDCGGRFTLNVDNFKKGLALMDKFAGWYGNLHDDHVAGKRDTPTLLNLRRGVCTRDAGTAVLKFLLEEIAVNEKLPLDAENPEDLFGMANNPAMRFVGRGYTMSFANSLAQIPPEKRSVLYAVVDVLDKLPANGAQLAGHEGVTQTAILAGRVMRHFDAVAALRAAGNLDRAHLVPVLYSDLNLPPDAGNKQINDALDHRISEENEDIFLPLHMLAVNSGATVDEAAEAIRSGRRLDNAPGISLASGNLEELDGTAAGGRKTMVGDLYRPSTPLFTEGLASAIPQENAKFVFRFPGGETLVAKPGDAQSEEVVSSCDAIAHRLEELCGKMHPKQLSNVYFALSQSAVGGNVSGGLEEYGIQSDEHMAITFSISRNDATGAVTIKYSEPEGLPVKFNWTTTIDVNGNSVTSPMRIDHGQYEAEAMTHADGIATRMPGKDRAAADALVRDLLAYCGDDFDLKDIVSKNIYDLCITATADMRTTDQIKAKIDAIRANLAEARAAADGNAAAERAGVVFVANLSGKSVPQGLVGNIVKATATANPGEYAKLSSSSSPKQLFQAVVDMRAAVEKAVVDARVGDVLEGGDEMTAVRDYIASLILSRFSSAALQGAVDAFRGETALKLLTLLNTVSASDCPGRLTDAQEIAFEEQRAAMGFLFGQYNLAAESALGKIGGEYLAFDGPINRNALGQRDILQSLLSLANDQVAAQAEEARRDANVKAAQEAARSHAANAYSKAGEGNAGRVDNLIDAALQRCSANADAVQIVANNMDAILVTNTSTLRPIAQVRERAEAIAANFAELQALSRHNPAIYEAGKRLMAGLGGKALPPRTIGRLVAAARKAGIDAIRKLSSRSSGLDIHHAVTQLRDNLVQAMNASGAEEETGGPNEKQACRNFIAALMMDRCGARFLHAMQGAFGGDTPAKLLTFYEAVGDGRFNGDVEPQFTIRLEDQGASHMTHLGVLKDAIDIAVSGQPGEGLVPFAGDLNADEIDGSDIFDDLLNIASR